MLENLKQAITGKAAPASPWPMLPATAAERMARLAAELAAAETASAARVAVMNIDTAATNEAKLALAFFDDAEARAGQKGNPSERARLEGAVATAKEAQRLNSARVEAGPREVLTGAMKECTRLVAGLSKPVAAVAVRLREGASSAMLWAARQKAIAEIKAVKASRDPFEVAAKHLTGIIDKDADRGAPRGVMEPIADLRDARPNLKPYARIRWPEVALPVRREHGFEPVNTVDTVAVLTWLHRDAIKKQVLDSLKREYEKPGLTMTGDERAQKLKSLEGQLEGIEREMAEMAFATGELAMLKGLSAAHVLGVRA